LTLARRLNILTIRPSLLQALEKEMQKLALELAGWLHDNEMSAES
jgi:hypothetical protein